MQCRVRCFLGFCSLIGFGVFLVGIYYRELGVSGRGSFQVFVCFIKGSFREDKRFVRVQGQLDKVVFFRQRGEFFSVFISLEQGRGEFESMMWVFVCLYRSVDVEQGDVRVWGYCYSLGEQFLCFGYGGVQFGFFLLVFMQCFLVCGGFGCGWLVMWLVVWGYLVVLVVRGFIVYVKFCNFVQLDFRCWKSRYFFFFTWVTVFWFYSRWFYFYGFFWLLSFVGLGGEFVRFIDQIRSFVCCDVFFMCFSCLVGFRL